MSNNKRSQPVPRPPGDFTALLATDEPLFLVDGRITERDMLDLLERLLNIIISSKGNTVLDKLNISGREMFSELKQNSSSKISSFINKCLVRKLPTLVVSG